MSKNFEVLQKLEQELGSPHNIATVEEQNENIKQEVQSSQETVSKPAGNINHPPPHEIPSADSIDSIKKTRWAKTPLSPGESPGIDIDVKQVNPNIVALTNEDIMALEQYRSLRTKVLKMAKLPDKNTILVTSSSPGEGKTLTAINLALTIVKGVNEKVLLIDCDLRCPSIHKMLGFEARHGLSHYLQQKAGVASIIHKTNIPKLSIIPAGEPLSRSSELLGSDRMVNLIKETKSRYNDRYIIFDSPPIIPATDSSVLVEHMDWAIFVIQAGKTPRDTVGSAISLFNREKIMGIVVNNIEVMPQEYKQSYKNHSKSTYGY